MTRDIDVCLLTGFGNEKKYIKSILENFKTRIKKPLEFAIENRVLLIKTSNNVPIDISLSAIEYEKEVIQNSSYYKFPGNCRLKTCSLNDLIILKAFADRNKDWSDIESIILRNKKSIDKTYILKKLSLFEQIKPDSFIKDKFIKYLN